MGAFDYALLGAQAVLLGPELFSVAGIPIPATVAMVLAGFLLGIAVGATPGVGGPLAMAISLPLLISGFGYGADALLPVLGFLIGVMKGATVGGAVPAILFNTPGTADSYLTTFDGFPMTRRGKAGKALRVAHFSSASGDTFSDMVLILCAPFLAIFVETYLDLPEKTALLILSLSFIAAAIGGSVGKGLISAGLGLLAAFVASGEDFYPRLSLGTETLAQGFAPATAVLGILILGEVFKEIEDLARQKRRSGRIARIEARGDQRLTGSDIRRIVPYVGRSALIGAGIGALPGIGSTLAATIGYAVGKRIHSRRPERDREFGEGAPEGVAATEAANSSVSGANLIPVLSLGIPGNTAAVFLILAAESIGGFNPGPTVFRFAADEANPELVVAFGIFVAMLLANLANWTVGGAFMRAMSVMARVPKQALMPCVLLFTFTGLYVGAGRIEAIYFALGFGILGYVFRRLGISPLPFVIAFILGERLEATARQAYAATGNDPWFLFTQPIAAAFMALSLGILLLSARSRRKGTRA